MTQILPTYTPSHYTTLFRSDQNMADSAAAKIARTMAAAFIERPPTRMPRRTVPSLYVGRRGLSDVPPERSEEHTSEIQSPCNIVFSLLIAKKYRTRDLTRCA